MEVEPSVFFTRVSTLPATRYVHLSSWPALLSRLTALHPQFWPWCHLGPTAQSARVSLPRSSSDEQAVQGNASSGRRAGRASLLPHAVVIASSLQRACLSSWGGTRPRSLSRARASLRSGAGLHQQGLGTWPVPWMLLEESSLSVSVPLSSQEDCAGPGQPASRPALPGAPSHREGGPFCPERPPLGRLFLLLGSPGLAFLQGGRNQFVSFRSRRGQRY